MKIVLFAADANENSLGRVYVLWMLARHLGWDVTTVAHRGARIWAPLAGTDFGDSVLLRRSANRKSVTESVEEAVSQADLLIGCKPRPESSGVAIRLARKFRKPVVIDIDDPDFEFQFDAPFVRRVRSWLTRPLRRIGYIRLRRNIANYALLVSNDVLRRRYGGWVVPHARPIREAEAVVQHSDGPLDVAFVGTVHPHKGVHVLREAVRRVKSELPITLTITDVAPADATPEERWLGNIPFQAGLDLVASSDVIVIPSLDRGWGRAQLPAKLMDAMIAGRPIIVTDVAPLKWAVGDAALVVEQDDADAIAAALVKLRTPEARAEYGERARRRAIELFSLESVSIEFELACRTTAVSYATEEESSND